MEAVRERQLRRIVDACDQVLGAADVFSTVVARSSVEDVLAARKQVERLFRYGQISRCAPACPRAPQVARCLHCVALSWWVLPT